MALHPTSCMQPEAFGARGLPSEPAPHRREETVASPSLQLLHTIFPDLAEDVLSDILAMHNDDVEAATIALIDDSVTKYDAETARALQLEQDEDMAKAVQASITRELQAEAEARRQREFPAVASRAMSNTAHMLLQRVTRKRAKGENHSVPLLETPTDSLDTTPLDVPVNYSPPTMLPRAEQPSCNEDSQDPSTRYSSRLDRARTANRQRTQSRLALALQPDETSVAPLQMQIAMPAVSKGELI